MLPVRHRNAVEYDQGAGKAAAPILAKDYTDNPPIANYGVLRLVGKDMAQKTELVSFTNLKSVCFN